MDWVGWVVVGFAILAGASAYPASYRIGLKQGKQDGIAEQEARQHEVFEQERLKRRNALLDRGRTTDRRPEHDGMTPARQSRIRVVGGKTGPLDQRRTR